MHRPRRRLVGSLLCSQDRLAWTAVSDIRSDMRGLTAVDPSLI